MTGNVTDLDALKRMALEQAEPTDPETSAKTAETVEADPLDGYTAVEELAEPESKELSPRAAARAKVKVKPKREKRERVMAHPAGFKQLSVKIDVPSYARMKQAAHLNEMSHQDIMYDAIIFWLEKHGY